MFDAVLLTYGNFVISTSKNRGKFVFGCVIVFLST